jgi:glycosyltransferase involved in cell wall biosynthesis
MIPLAEGYERRGLRCARQVFALSEYTRRAVSSICDPSKVTLAPCGIDTDLFRPGPSAAGDYLICVARFSDPRKNVRLLLDAYAAVRHRVAQLPDLYLIGDPPSEASQQYLQRLGLAGKVRLMGPKSGEELATLFRNALFFVLPSNEEGLAIVILEAMASGLAVVSTDCGGPSTAITEGETGFLTPVGDVSALAAAMEKLLADPALRQRLGQAGRRCAVERFSFAAAGRIFLEKYDEFFASQESRVESLESKSRTAARTLDPDYSAPTPDSRLSTLDS